MPPALRDNLGSLLEEHWDGDLAALLWEGTALQLLAHALRALEDAPAAEAVSERDRRLLRRVHERLVEEPGAAHTLASLAALACMSPSALRAKFPGSMARACSIACVSSAWSGPVATCATAPRCSRPPISWATATPATSPPPSAPISACHPVNGDVAGFPAPRIAHNLPGVAHNPITRQ